MIKVHIVSVGSIKEKFFVDAINEYKKRLSRFCQFDIIEVGEEASISNIAQKCEKESSKLLTACKGTKILLDRVGELVSSEKISEIIDKCQNLGDSELSFIIGGSNGVTEEFKAKCKYVISFGKITFPHQLFRVVLSEQIYRAFTILNNLPYHK